MSFMGFFVNAHDVWTFNLGTTGFFFLGLFSALWFLDMAWYREQTCNYICPYARFQSALIDKDSLVIAYDAGRGDPRGSRSKKANAAAQGLGDCDREPEGHAEEQGEGVGGHVLCHHAARTRGLTRGHQTLYCRFYRRQA